MRRALDEARGLARGQALLRLSAELRVGHLQREHEGDAVPHVLGRELVARRQVAEIAEFPTHRWKPVRRPLTLRAVLRSRDQVDVAFLRVRRRARAQPVDDLGVLLPANRRTVPAAALRFAEFALQVVAQAIFVMPRVLFAGRRIEQGDRSAEGRAPPWRATRCPGGAGRTSASEMPGPARSAAACRCSSCRRCRRCPAPTRSPSAKFHRYSLPSRLMNTSTFFDSAFATLTPTPCDRR